MGLVTRQDEERLLLLGGHLGDLLEAGVLVDADLDALVVHANEQVVDDGLQSITSQLGSGGVHAEVRRE